MKWPWTASNETPGENIIKDGMGKPLNFKMLRERSGLNQHQFALRLGIGHQFISNFEREVAPLPPKYFQKVAALCNVEVKDLVQMSIKRYERKLREKIPS